MAAALVVIVDTNYSSGATVTTIWGFFCGFREDGGDSGFEEVGCR